MSKMAERIALGLATIIGNLFIASGKRNRLEAQEADGLGIVEVKLNNASNLLIVNAVDDGRNRNNVNAGFMQIVDGSQLNIKQVADLAMRVGSIADAIELQISIAKACFSSLAAEL